MRLIEEKTGNLVVQNQHYKYQILYFLNVAFEELRTHKQIILKVTC